MTNARKELLNAIKNKAEIKCALIYYEKWDSDTIKIALKQNYTNKEYEEFLVLLDFDYDSGFGGQELYGDIWLKDGTWLSRREYDGSEWWEHNFLPEIPDDCL